MGGTVSAISIAPVKGLGLLHPPSVELTVDGVPGDRRYALVDSDGNLANGKRFGPLVRVRPAYDDDPESLTLTMPDGRSIGGAVTLGERVDAVFYGAVRAARLVEGPYAAELSGLAGEPLRLVRLERAGQGIDRRDDGVVSLLSGAALDLMTEQAQSGEPIDPRRFRMTFTIAGVEAHAEDDWIGRDVRVGDAGIRPAGNIGRCAITTHDPDTGAKTLDTLHLIATARGDLATTEKLPFGVHAAVVVPGHVRVGDSVEPS